MTDRQKVAHLLRRLGLGASRSELDLLERRGVDGTLQWLFESTDEQFPLSAWQFCREDGNDTIYLDPARFALWWSIRTVVSRRPLPLRLSVVWHSHFAVSGSKVEFGPLLKHYIDQLVEHGDGSFVNLLKAIAASPAMVRYLDMDESFVGRPNENFARELLELFTVGRGNYTEADIKELARVFTGRGVRYILFEAGEERVIQRMREAAARDLPMAAYAFSPDLHDKGVKSVLSQTGRFSGDELLEHLSGRRETAQHVCRRLWSWLGSPDLNSPAVQRMVAIWLATRGDIRETLSGMVRHPDFWDPKTVRSIVKTPYEFVVPIMRQFDLHPILLQLQAGKHEHTDIAAKPLRDTAALVWGTMFQMGMGLLFPPNVGGWERGTSWITSANMLARIRFAEVLCGIGQPDRPLAAYLASRITQSGADSDEDAVAWFLENFDADLPDEKRKVVLEAFRAKGGVSTLGDPMKSSESLAAMGRLVFGAPEFQMF